MRLTPEQQALAADPCIIKQATQGAEYYFRRYRGYDYDDFLSAALLAVTVAACKFDGRGNFLGYARYHVRGALLNVIRDRPAKGFRKKLREEWTPPVQLSLRGWRMIPDRDRAPPGFFEEQHEEIEAMLASLAGPGLGRHHAEAVRRWILYAGNRQVDVGATAGKTRQAANQIIRTAKNHIRAAIVERGVLVTAGRES